MFGTPEFRTIDAPAAIVVCPLCKKVQVCQYLEPTDEERPVSGRAEFAPRSGDTVLVVWLKCEEPACETPLPLFAQWKDSDTEGERRADIETWRWDGLRCPAGHAIAQPEDS